METRDNDIPSGCDITVDRHSAAKCSKPKSCELMSPAGGWPQLRAAVEAGADAVYFGLDQFSARAKVGFHVDELPEVLDCLHERGVLGFVTFNTLVFDDELDRACELIEAMAIAGADAIIVQDIGIARLAHQIAPHLPIHGSTQMTITSAQGCEVAKSLGCSRVVLARELSLSDIAQIRSQTDLELEVFVHGALCVSYSGQCFSSEAWGGRSANRGQCAQACRLSYELVVDGKVSDTSPNRYLLSPGDLFALQHVPDLVRVGVSCLKIEGRYKDEYYVAATTQAYRRAIDAATGNADPAYIETERQRLEQLYSRGLGPFFLQGVNHQEVVDGRAPRHRGVQVGTVYDIENDRWVEVDLQRDIRPGDGIVFDAADWRSPDEPEEGGNVYSIDRSPSEPTRLRLRFANKAIDFSRIRVGDRVWRTSDPQVLVELKPIARRKDHADPVYTRPLDLHLRGRTGQPLTVVASIENGIEVTVVGEVELVPADYRKLTADTLRKQLGRLGGTPFHLNALTTDLGETGLFVPVSHLNDLRRHVVEQLVDQRKAARRSANRSSICSIRPSELFCNPVFDGRKKIPPLIHLLVRNAEQLDAAIECRPASITLDYLELYGLRPSVEQIRRAGIRVRVASPRILKPVEQNVFRFLVSLDCDLLARSTGLVRELNSLPTEQRPVVDGDFSLNAANFISVNTLLVMGLNRIAPTWDLNAAQITALSEHVDPSRLEVIVMGHLPVFHTEHCVFCRFLSSGTDNTNCGHPCEKHRVALRDHAGRIHPLMADVGCRNTVFGAQTQVSVNWIERWQNAGIQHFRIEFADESPEQVRGATSAFQQFFSGTLATRQLAEYLSHTANGGTTKGSFYVPGGQYSMKPQV